MSYSLRVLNAIVTVSRSNSRTSNALSRAVLLERAGGSESAFGDALATLVARGWLQSGADPLRLTLEGLAVGTAYVAQTARLRQEAEAEAALAPATNARMARVGSRERRAVPRNVASRAA